MNGAKNVGILAAQRTLPLVTGVGIGMCQCAARLSKVNWSRADAVVAAKRSAAACRVCDLWVSSFTPTPNPPSEIHPLH